jgi:thioredoxin-like negative regulator of GroEL
MNLIDLTEDNFNAALEANPFVVIGFWAGRWGLCRQFAPVFSAAAARHPAILFARIDSNAEPDLALAFQIRSIPTLVIIREKIMLVCESGMQSPQTLERLIEYARILDMDDIRTEIAAHEGDEDAIDW